MSASRCYSCASVIVWKDTEKGGRVACDPRLVQGVRYGRSGYDGPLLKGEKLFDLQLETSRRYERCRPVREDETTGILTGFVCHRSTCQKQGVPKS